MSDGGIQKFLGNGATRGGAPGLLGLAGSSFDDAAIRGALRERLSAISAHPERDTPEADEVRLALHAAAAQLMDPSVRQRMGVSPRAPSSGRAGSDALQADASVDSVLFDVVRLVASRGGLGRDGVRRLTRIAYARGVPMGAIAAGLRRVTGRRAEGVRPDPFGGATAVAARAGSDAMEVPGGGSVGEPSAPARSEMSGVTRAALLAAGTFAVVVLGLLGVWIVATSPPSPSAGPQAGAGTPAGGGGGAMVAAAPRVPDADPIADAVVRTAQEAAPTVAPDGNGVALERLVRDLQAASTADELDRAALSGLIARLAGDWPRLRPSELAACTDAVVESAYRLSDAGGFAWYFEVIAEGSDGRDARALPRGLRVERAVWSLGMLTRLAAERDLPALARSRVVAALARRLGSDGVSGLRSFDAGAVRAMGHVAGRLAAADGGTAAAWRSWLRCVEALAGGDAGVRTTLVLRGLDALITQGAPPDRSNQAFAAAMSLAAALSWRSGEGGRGWLLDRFDDPAVSNAHLHAMTTGIATRSAAAGVDATMVLRPGDTALARRDLRDRYASAWGIATGTDTSAWRTRWRTLSMRAIGAEAASVGDWLRRAVVLSRLSEAASMEWRGDLDAARSALDAAEAMLEDRSGTRGAETAGIPVARATGWWSRYLAVAESVPARMDLLLEISGRAPESLSAQAGTVLVREAVRGTPERVRAAARDAVRRLASSPAVVKAALDELPRTAPNAANRQLIGWLTGGAAGPVEEAESWEFSARRGLVQRLLELLASAGPLAETDEMVAMLGASYGARAGIVRTDDARVGASALRADRRERAMRLIPGDRSPTTLGAIERRRVARGSLARGPVQAFCVEQLAAVELLAYIVSIERPALAGDVGAVLADLDADRRGAGHVFQQVAVGEEASVRLWLARAGEVMP